MNDVPTSSCITPSSMDGIDEGGSDWSSGIEKVKVVCCRGDDDGKSSDASSIGKCGSLEIWHPGVRTLPHLVPTPPPLVRSPPPLVQTPPPLVHIPPSLIITSSSDDCLYVSTTLGGISNLSASCITSKVVAHN